jgi:hypothetical protein
MTEIHKAEDINLDLKKKDRISDWSEERKSCGGVKE